MSLPQPINVLVVEDNIEVRARICAAIDDDVDLNLWGRATTIHEALQRLATGLPAIALIDLGLPDGGGEAVIAWLHRHAPQVESLVLTVFADEKHVMSAIRSGASGYLLKCDTAENLTESIKRVFRGESPISPAVARFILNSTRQSSPAALQSGPHVAESKTRKPKLTPTEVEILNYVAKGFTSPEIAQITGKSVNTVPVHIKNIYKKLSVSGRGEAVYQAMKFGIIGS